MKKVRKAREFGVYVAGDTQMSGECMGEFDTEQEAEKYALRLSNVVLFKRQRFYVKEIIPKRRVK